MLKHVASSIALVMFCSSAHSADWDGIAVPAPAGPGKAWQIQTISDEFNYSSTPTNKPNAFKKRWKDSFINPWLGPGDSEFSSGHSYTINGALALQSAIKQGTDKIYTGVISSKETFSYPLYMEVLAKPSNNTLANGVWLLSPDSTQEIDAMEAYGSDRPDQEWFDRRMHISHHVFIRNPFQDYQPTDPGSWVYNEEESWRARFHRYGVHWIDPWTLDYYIDGVFVRRVSGQQMIDPLGYTAGTGLNKAMHIIMDVEHQDWRDKPSAAEMADDNRNIFFVDWIRVYKPINL